MKKNNSLGRHRQTILILVGIIFILFLISFASAWTINGDIVYINDSNAYISATPHTLTSSGWVTFNVLSKIYTGNVDLVLGFDTDRLKPIELQKYVGGEWVSVTKNIPSIDYDYGGMNKWWYIEDYPIQKNVNYTFRVKIKVNTFGENKYWFAIKPSSETMQQAISNGHLYSLDPWVDSYNTGLVAYYTLDESSGTTAYDYTKNHNGTNYGATVSATGKINTAYDFVSAENDYVNVTNSTAFNTANLTISAWIKADALDGRPLAKWENGHSWILISTGTYWDFEIANSTTLKSLRITQALDTDWHLHTITYDGINVYYYIDGSLANSTIMGGEINTTPSYIMIGAQSNVDYPFDGTIDEVGIWNRSLNSTEISDLYNSGAGMSPEYVFYQLSPSDNYESISILPVNFYCGVNLTSGTLANISLLTNETSWSVKNTTSVTGITNITNWYRTFSLGSYLWECEACDDTGYCYHSANRTLGIKNIAENSQTYNSSIYETEQGIYILNLSYDSSEWSSISGNLIYNGTAYSGTKSGTGDTITYTKSLDIQTVSANTNKTFYWTIYLTNSSGTYAYNSTSYNQTVQNLIFINCNATYPTKFVNYSIYEETNLALINSSFDATFNYWVGAGDIYENYSFSSSADNTSFAFCTNVNKTFNVDSKIDLEALNYNKRIYEFNDEVFTNSTTYKLLYLLNSSLATNVIIEVKDTGLSPLKGYFVTIERYYPETGLYKVVVNEKTDEFGQFVASLIENTVKYKFAFRDSDNVLIKQTGDIIIACRSTYCIVPFVIAVAGTEFEEFTNITSYSYTLSFSNTTNEFTFSWNDLTGDSAIARLEVTRYLLNGSSVICNTTSTSSSSSLTCSVGSSQANYKAQAFRSVGGNERRIAILNYEVGSPVETYGAEGLLWVFILLMTLISVGAFNPTAGALLYGVGFIAFGTLGLISMPISVFFANTLLVAIFIWAVNRK